MLNFTLEEYEGSGYLQYSGYFKLHAIDWIEENSKDRELVDIDDAMDMLVNVGAQALKLQKMKPEQAGKLLEGFVEFIKDFCMIARNGMDEEKRMRLRYFSSAASGES